MTNTNSSEDLGHRIEQLVQEHIAASRKAAQDAVERAFASGAQGPIGTARPVKRFPGKKRASVDIAVLGERFYKAVSAKPGETMTVLAVEIGMSARELHRSVTLLRRAGRVRAVGSRHLTRYFPMANGTATSV
jgi:methionine synthase I (cobalamin-dependent)